MKTVDIEKSIKQFIKAVNAFDVNAALILFAKNAVIDDVSVGAVFKNTSGIREYLEKYFVGYHTKTKLESVEILNNMQAIAQLDFTGDFGHETGALNVTINAEGFITRMDAHLD